TQLSGGTNRFSGLPGPRVVSRESPFSGGSITSTRRPPSRVMYPGGGNATARHADGNCSHHALPGADEVGHTAGPATDRDACASGPARGARGPGSRLLE